MSDVILRNLRLLDPRRGEVRDGLEVLVQGGRIAEVERRVSRTDARVLDLGGRVLMPGLIDCHVHIMASHVRFGLKATGHIPASLVTAYAARSLRAMLRRGFTTVRDAGGADLGHKLAVERGLFQGPRLFVSGRAISQTGGHGDFRERVDVCVPCACAHMLNGIGRIADGVPEVRRAARDEIRLGADQIKVMASGGVASAADPIHFLQYSVEELEALVDEAARASTYVMAHAYTPEAIRRSVAAGVRTIEHGNLLDEETARFMRERGAFLVPTLSTYFALAERGAELGFPEESLRKLNDVLGVGTTSLAIARDAGVKMAVGTDLLGELQAYQSDEFRIRAETLSPAEIVRSATVVGAEVLRMEGRLGEIVPGAHADLIAVNGNPLEDISLLGGQGDHLALVVKGGEVFRDALDG
ncbi:MAG TPA: amidohydrolase family protein [Geminicoccaceae bacterium]|nr:amidohydrolase family protein [Geminicoccaceae bacterium]